MRVLITGAEGQLGTDLAVHCRDRGDDVVALGRSDLDIAQRDAVFGVITSDRFDVVFNAAAFTAVDRCESEEAEAFAANAMAVRWLAVACGAAGAHLVHLSTDYVFDGTKDEPYHEWDRPNPQSVYGRSKWAGEHEVAVHGASSTIVRTSWVCSAHGGNMLDTILRLAAEHDTLRFVDDQRGNPTFTTDLAFAVRRLAAGRVQGLFHVTNQGAVSWFEFAQAVLAAAGLDPERVEPIATVDLVPARPAPRPKNSVLENRALQLSGLAVLPDFRSPLEEAIAARRG